MKTNVKVRVELVETERKRLLYATELSRERGIDWHEANGWRCLGWRATTQGNGHGGTRVVYEVDYARTKVGGKGESEELKCPRCGSTTTFRASHPRFMHRCHICDWKWRDASNPGSGRKGVEA